MVTKLNTTSAVDKRGSVLAKIHMVTKLCLAFSFATNCSVLAKIHMVTKPQKYGSTFLNVIEY